MKIILICLACLLTLCACGRQPAVIAGDAGETEVAYADLDRPITAETTLDDEAVSCVPLQKDGSVYGFEMRFRQSDAVDALLRNAENVYFGVLQYGKDKLPVPMEDIRILPDITTDEFVLTLLVPQEKKLHTQTCTVSFYIAAHADSADKTLFCAEKTVGLP